MSDNATNGEGSPSLATFYINAQDARIKCLGEQLAASRELTRQFKEVAEWFEHHFEAWINERIDR